MPPWMRNVISCQNNESKINSSRWLQLATIGLDNTPSVRTVVFRGWTSSFEMKIFTDKRTKKINELLFNNNVQLCWLFSKTKCQFRFSGKSTVDLGNDRIQHWNELDNNTKSMWYWPNPGATLLLDKKVDSQKNNYLDVSDNFMLLKIHIYHVDQLLLHNPIHTRKRWLRRNGGWIEEQINP